MGRKELNQTKHNAIVFRFLDSGIARYALYMLLLCEVPFDIVMKK